MPQELAGYSDKSMVATTGGDAWCAAARGRALAKRVDHWRLLEDLLVQLTRASYHEQPRNVELANLNAL